MNIKVIEQIAGMLFMTREEAHKAHIGTNSYAHHMALEDFYNGIDDLKDKFIEAAQGKHGILDIPDMKNQVSVLEPVAMLEDHLAKINRLAAKCNEQFLQAIIDEINGCFYRTLYKLKYLN